VKKRFVKSEKSDSMEKKKGKHQKKPYCDFQWGGEEGKKKRPFLGRNGGKSRDLDQKRKRERKRGGS